MDLPLSKHFLYERTRNEKDRILQQYKSFELHPRFKGQPYRVKFLVNQGPFRMSSSTGLLLPEKKMFKEWP